MQRTINHLTILCALLGMVLTTMFLGQRLAEGAASIHVEDGERHIISDGLPSHSTGSFPNVNNPNRISAQRYHFRMPLEPRKVGRITQAQGYLFGVGLNGVPFDPGTAEQWDPTTGSHRRGGRPTGWRYEAITGPHDLGLDHNHAHVQPGGAYHYHGVPNGMIEGNDREQIGWAADGFPIFHDPSVKASYRLRGGNRPAGGPDGQYDGQFEQDWIYVDGVGDLDECNGMNINDPARPELTYGYFVTDSFPFIGRCFVGIPHMSFKKDRAGDRFRPRQAELRPVELRVYPTRYHYGPPPRR